MASLRAFWTHHRRLAAVLMALTLAVRAIVPSGYMVAASSPKSITVYVCAQAGEMANTVTIPIDSDLPADGHDKDKQSDCAFAGMASAADLPVADIADFGVFAGHFVHQHPLISSPGRGLAAPPPFATGPPILI